MGTHAAGTNHVNESFKIGPAGEVLRALRGEAGLSQPELAEKLGWDPTRLSKYENNRLMLSLDVIDKIARALGVPAEAVVLRCRTATPRWRRPTPRSAGWSNRWFT
jgi:transcriptional regulator with XRE-family HTH domain